MPIFGGNKDIGPLPKAQKEIDLLKKRVDNVVKESEKCIRNVKMKDRDVKLKALYQNCVDLNKDVPRQTELVQELTSDQEPRLIKDHEKRKQNELKRLELLKTHLEATLVNFPESVKDEFESAAPEAINDESTEVKQPVEPRALDDNDGDEKTKKGTKSREGQEDEDEDDDEDDDDEDDDEEDDDEDEDDEQDDDDDDLKDEETEAQQRKVLPSSPKAAPTTSKSVSDISDKTAQIKTTLTEPSDDEDDDDEEDDEEDDEVDDEETEEEEEMEEEEESEDESDEEEDEEEDDAQSVTDLEQSSTMRQFEAIADFTGEEDGDLTFKQGDILSIINTREDGWWEAENEKGIAGVVPKSHLKLYNKYKDIQHEDTDNDEHEDDDESSPEGKKLKKQRSGKDLWRGISKTLAEQSATDVLHAMGALPSGFRQSTLGQKFNHSDEYRMMSYLSPKLSASNLSYKDLFLDPANNKIRHRPVRIQKLITLNAARLIPPPATGLEVLSRHVRMCLFDGENILSNIHCVRVAMADRSQRTWTFTTRVSDTMDTYQHAEVFVRTNSTLPNLGVLFELCVTYKRTSTGEEGEYSCGWVHMTLADKDGVPIINKTYDLYVHGGTPYEQGVDVDPSISRRGSNAPSPPKNNTSKTSASSPLMSLISGNKQPRLVVKVTMPKQEQKELLDTLPDALVGNMCLVNFYSYHRQLLADSLLRDRLDLDSTEPIYSPVLVNFPTVADHHDVMSMLRNYWIQKQKTLRRSEKRDEEYMKRLFCQTFMEVAYPLCYLTSMPDYISGNVANGQVRAVEIGRFQHATQASVLAALCSPEFSYSPFEMSEASFSVLGPHCQQRHVHVSSS